jgi:hypothetical protein
LFPVHGRARHKPFPIPGPQRSRGSCLVSLLCQSVRSLRVRIVGMAVSRGFRVLVIRTRYNQSCTLGRLARNPGSHVYR